MKFKVTHLKKIMEEFAPSYLKETYDNVGLMVGDLNWDVSNILIALDCTLNVIKEAQNKGCSVIITHHPLLFNRPDTITEESLVGSKIIRLIQNNIALYSSHTNLDSVKGGLNDIFAELMGFKDYIIMEPNNTIDGIHKNGIGRLITLNSSVTLLDICSSLKAALGINNLRYVGQLSTPIKKVALINGSGEDYYEVSKKYGADLVITGDTKYHNTSDYYEMGLCIIDAGHFETEWPLFKIFANKLKKVLQQQGFENNVIISESCIPVYGYL